MNQEVQIFNNPEFGEIRIVDVDGELYFVGKDVASILGYTNPQKALRDHVPDKYKTVNESFTVNGTAPVLINEAGLYKLVMRSKLPNAEKFSDWACEEVLPSIRKQGVYMTPEAAAKILYNPDFIINLAQQVKDANAKIAILQPKADYTDKVLQSPSTILTTTIGGVGRGACRGSLSTRIQRYRIRLWREKNLRGNSFPISGDNLRGKNFSCRPRRFLRQKNLEKIISQVAPRLPPNPDSTPPFCRSLAFVLNRQINNKSYLPMSSMIMTGFKSFSVSSCFETNKPLHFANNSNAFNTSLTAAGFVVNVPFGSTTVSSTSPFAIADSLSCTSSAVNIFSLVIASFSSFILA